MLRLGFVCSLAVSLALALAFAGCGTSSAPDMSGAAAGGADEGTGAGGAAGGAAGAGAGPSGCHTVADCPKNTSPMAGMTLCLSPGQRAPADGCGAIDWCGQCGCGPQPLPPLGDGKPCQDSSDCPAAMLGVETASICDNGRCTECASSTDCPVGAPACGVVQFPLTPYFKQCQECTVDLDCPTAKPYCAVDATNGLIGKCAVCASADDCPKGLCVRGSCVPECSQDQDCGPLMKCSAEQRCEALTCQDNAQCPPETDCLKGPGLCGPRSCAIDAQCDAGARCVNSFCYESLGTCYTQMIYP